MGKNKTIRALIQYAIYSSAGHIAIYGTLVVGFGVLFLAMGGMTMFPGVAIPILAMASLVSSAEEKSNWNRFQLTTPTTRRQVIISRYGIYFLFMLAGLAVAGIFTGLGYLLTALNILGQGELSRGVAYFLADYDPMRATLMFTISGIGAALLTCSVYYPLVYTFFKGREEGLAFVATILSFALAILIAWLGLRLELSIFGMTLFLLAVSVVLLVCSYLATVKIYDKVDV